VSVSDARLAQIAARFAELEARLASGTLEGPEFVAASRDYAELEPVAKAARDVTAMRAELASLSALNEADPEMRALAEEEPAGRAARGGAPSGGCHAAARFGGFAARHARNPRGHRR
jgi:peptide chain release factor 1